MGVTGSCRSAQSVARDRCGNAIGVVAEWRLDIEGVGKADKEVEQRADVNCLGDLGLGPAGVAQTLDLFVGDSVGVSGEGTGELQQEPLGGRDRRAIEIAVAECLRHWAVLFALQLQEPGVAAQSIMAAIERGDIRGDHFVLGAGQGAV